MIGLRAAWTEARDTLHDFGDPITPCVCVCALCLQLCISCRDFSVTLNASWFTLLALNHSFNQYAHSEMKQVNCFYYTMSTQDVSGAMQSINYH